jgi:hypothetical protein
MLATDRNKKNLMQVKIITVKYFTVVVKQLLGYVSL